MLPRSRETSRSRTQYFRDVGVHELMDKETELALAKDIADCETRAWREALCYPPALDWIKQLVHTGLDEPPSFSRVEAAARAVRKTRRKAERCKLAAAAGRLAARIRDRDRDHLVLDELISSLRAMAPGEPSGELPVSTKSRSFQAFRRSVLEAAREAAAGRHQFVQSNLRLVIHVATRYSRYGVGLDDLIQEGNLGLIKAVDRFDYRKGNRFSTYATWWIHHTVGRAVADTSRTVRVPVHVRDTHQRAMRVTRALSRTLHRAPTDEEIAAELEIPVAKLLNAKHNLRSSNISLDEPIGEDETSTRQEVFERPDATGPGLAEQVANRSVMERLRGHLGVLTSQQADIIRRRFGLDGNREQTLREIADRYDLSRERIRQLEAKALERLRAELEKDGL